MQHTVSVEYYSKADDLVEKWLAAAEKGEVTYEVVQGQSQAAAAKASSAAFERKRRLLLPTAQDIVR